MSPNKRGGDSVNNRGSHGGGDTGGRARCLTGLLSLPVATGRWEGGPGKVGSPFELLEWKISHFILQASMAILD